MEEYYIREACELSKKSFRHLESSAELGVCRKAWECGLLSQYRCAHRSESILVAFQPDSMASKGASKSLGKPTVTVWKCKTGSSKRRSPNYLLSSCQRTRMLGKLAANSLIAKSAFSSMLGLDPLHKD